jgi:hypothetical protein
VTRDDIRRLMGAYATGSLTDAERKALFEAALDDQDLFDEPAREQAVKDVIAEPGVRDRLIAGLPRVDSQPVATAGGWKKPLAWGLSAAFVLSMSIAAVMITRSTDTRQSSQKVAILDGTLQPSAPAPATIGPGPIPQSASAPQPTPARAGAPAPSRDRQPLPENQRASAKKIEPSGFASGRLEAPKPAQNRDENRDEKRPAKDLKELDKAVSTQPAGSPSPAPPPPITNSPLEARRAQPSPLPTSSFAPGPAPNPAASPTSNSTTGNAVSKDQGQRDQRQKDQGQAAQPSDSSKPPQAADQVVVAASTGQVDQLRAQNAQINNGPADNSRSKAPPQFGVAAGRGGAEAKTSSVATARAAAPAASGGGGSARGAVGGTVAGLGTTRPPAHFAFDYKIEGEDLTLKFAADGYVSIHFVPGGMTVVGARVTAASTRREHIPANATEVTILFAAAPQPGAPGVSLTREPKDVRSGTVEDPGGARIDLLLRLY